MSPVVDQLPIGMNYFVGHFGWPREGHSQERRAAFSINNLKPPVNASFFIKKLAPGAHLLCRYPWAHFTCAV
jgi:hypothetical protein